MRLMRPLAVGLTCLLPAISPVQAQTLPDFHVSRAGMPPKIDGDLSDAVWEGPPLVLEERRQGDKRWLHRGNPAGATDHSLQRRQQRQDGHSVLATRQPIRGVVLMAGFAAGALGVQPTRAPRLR